MSSADDVLEMKSLTSALADRLVGKGPVKARVGAVADAIGVGANRALEFMKGKARRVDAWEKEHAKRRLEKLERNDELRREHEHLLWLEEQIGRHRASGEELRGPHVDALEHFLRNARGDAGAVAVQGEGEEAA